MKHIYYLDQRVRPDGYRLVHTALCESLGEGVHKHYLGVFSDCLAAIQEARRICPQAKGCVLCCHLHAD
ncbi:hypothetical protein EW445_18015 [Salmonella enterica subsp. enterica serovar Newport]|uniref:Uncharacterized protein n=1 Tax=Salmonella enterica subsp. salamae TaxID=59202 RepID=A0A5Y3MX41_SALER|nr:hypothetical protein [Salmonella enterica subsp. enterica serovar Newport]ECI4012529.1 hypothetical protein [Salmonella enterica subsp. salamae]